MPLNVKETTSQVSKKISSIPIIKSVIINPVLTAISIVFIMMIIILLIFRNVEFDEDQSLLRMTVRIGIYSFIFTAGLLFLHDNYLIKEMESKNKSGAMEELFSDVDKVGSGLPISSENVVPVLGTNAPIEISIPDY